VYVDRAFQRKTNELVQKHVTSSPIAAITSFVRIDADTIDLIKQKHGGDDSKVINLIKSIEKQAEEESGDPFLVAMADRARQVQESYEDRQTGTREALEELFIAIRKDQERRRAQAEMGYDSLRFFVHEALAAAGVPNAEAASAKVHQGFVDHPNWRGSVAELRELRRVATFAVLAEIDDVDRVYRIVEELFGTLDRAGTADA
jgi:type I restriction enzyme R subunit